MFFRNKDKCVQQENLNDNFARLQELAHLFTKESKNLKNKVNYVVKVKYFIKILLCNLFLIFILD